MKTLAIFTFQFVFILSLIFSSVANADVCSNVVIHPTVEIGNSPDIGCGTVINKGVSLGNNLKLGENVTINQGVKAGNNLQVGNNTVINKNSKIGNDVVIGSDVIIDQFVTIGSIVSIGLTTVIGKYADINDYVTIGEAVLMGKLVTVESGAMIGDFADISANTKVPLIFTTEMLAGKVFVPIQPPEQSTDVTIVRFSGDGNVFFYNQIPFSPFFQFFTWSWSIDGNGRLINDFPDPMPDRTVTLLANTPTYLEWQVVGQAQSERVIKVIPFNTVTLPGTYFIDGGGIITFFGNGTGSMGTENFTWSVDTRGVLIATFTGTNVVRANYLLADSTATTLNIAGIEFRNGDPVGLFDATLIRQ